MSAIRKLRTFSTGHVESQRREHTRADGYGRHRHLYLHATMRRLRDQVANGDPDKSMSLLDYGCGKGGFLQEMRALGLFAELAGYDPAVSEFRAHPDRTFDIVACLDVLDMVEPRFLDAVLDDAAQLASGLVVFDVLTRPNSGRLYPHPPFYWTMLVRQHLAVVQTQVEFADMNGFERVVIVAEPPTVQSANNARSSPNHGS